MSCVVTGIWSLRTGHTYSTHEVDIFELQPKVLTSEERAHLEAYLQNPPAEFTVPWLFGMEGHDMALHRRNYDLPQGAMFHTSCSCGWQSEPSTLEIDARALGALDVAEARRQKDGNLVLRFREHILTSLRLRNPETHKLNEERWVGLCACGWSCIERTEDDEDDALEKHWKALLDDPAMRADYLAFLKEEGLPLPGQTKVTTSADEILT